jgi:hypothetical protein
MTYRKEWADLIAPQITRALRVKLRPGFLEGSHLLTCQRRRALLLVDVRKVLNDNTWMENKS